MDFEEQCAALKLEVQEAWANYKSSQEKAAATESELQDEVKLIQKAKLLDKQQSVAQLTRLNEEVSEAVRQMQAAQAQRGEVQQKLDAAAEENSKWEERIMVVQRELQEAKSGTVQGVAALREELRVMQLHTEQMRVDHSSLLRQNQVRQAELERENAELTSSLTQQQKEIQRLQHFSRNNNNSTGTIGSNNNNSNSSGNMNIESYASRDYVTLQQEVISITAQLEQERDKTEEMERRLKVQEREARAASMNAEDERRRSGVLVDELSAKVADLESRLNARKLPPKGFHGAPGGYFLSSASADAADGGGAGAGGGGGNSDGAGQGGGDHKQQHLHAAAPLDYEQLMKELQDHRTQSQSLSKLLLKKQGSVLELQSERNALKSRLVDMQTRYRECVWVCLCYLR